MRNNSKAIAKAAQDLDLDANPYRQLFRRCHWVASAPGVFFWAGEHAVLSGALAICQQVPLRVYVGLECIDPSASEFVLGVGGDPTDHQEYDHAQSQAEGSPIFHPFQWMASSDEEDALIDTARGISPKLNSILSQIAKDPDLNLKGKYVFRSLHELRRGSGSDWSGAFSAALTGAMYAAAGVLATNRRWNDDWWSDPLLEKCNGWAWEIERLFHGVFASGYGTLCSMAPYACAQRYVIGWRKPDDVGGNPAIVIRLNERLADRLLAVAQPLVEDLPQALPWPEPPFEYGLIYSGVPKNTASRIVSTYALARELQSGLDSARELWPIQDGAPFQFQKGPTQVFGEAQTLTGGDLRQGLMEALGSSDLRVLDGLLRVLRVKPQSLGTVGDLASSIESVRGGLMMMDLNWDHADLVRGALLRALWKDRASIGVKPTGGAGGGHVLFVSPSLGWKKGDGTAAEGSAAEKLIHELGRVSKLTGDDLSIDWCRHRDDLDGEGLRIEITSSDRQSSLLGRRVEFSLGERIAPARIPHEIAECLKRDEVSVHNHIVFRDYVRADVRTVVYLRQKGEKILQYCRGGGEGHGFLLWGPSGSGKTSLISDIAKEDSLPLWTPAALQTASTQSSPDRRNHPVPSNGAHVRVNMADPQQRSLLADSLAAIRTMGGPVLCLFDEIDDPAARPLYGQIMALLDDFISRGHSAMVVAGSCSKCERSGAAGLANWIATGTGQLTHEPNKGRDLMTRIGETDSWWVSVPDLTLDDRIVIAAAHAFRYGVGSIQKAALLYILLRPEFANARAIGDLVKTACTRLGEGHSVLVLNHLFDPGFENEYIRDSRYQLYEDQWLRVEA